MALLPSVISASCVTFVASILSGFNAHPGLVGNPSTAGNHQPSDNATDVARRSPLAESDPVLPPPQHSGCWHAAHDGAQRLQRAPCHSAPYTAHASLSLGRDQFHQPVLDAAPLLPPYNRKASHTPVMSRQAVSSVLMIPDQASKYERQPCWLA